MKLKVSGIEKLSGNLMIAVFDNSDSFPNEEKAIQRIVIPVESLNQMIEIEGLTEGKSYAIAMYHDKNGNNQLDKNFLGIPTERYGFSNNARATFGPPSFKESQISFNRNKIYQITLK